MDVELYSIIPSLRVTSIIRALPFYETLGFKLVFAFAGSEHSDTVTDQSHFARLDAEATHPLSIFLETRRGSTGGCIHIMAGAPENVDRLAARLRAEGVVLELEPTNMPWGMREMHTADPDGNLIVIGGLLAE